MHCPMRLTAIVLWAVAGCGVAPAQQAEIFFQATDGAALRPLSAAEKQNLQDPMFKLVLSQQPGETRLAEIERLIQPDRTKRRIFVVDEEIKNAAKPQSRRAVVDFTGSHQGVQLDRNLMLSISFSSNGVPVTGSVEAWGWDEARGVYNYYKLDRSGTPGLTWKLRATSRDADTLTPQQRQGSCLACHTTGVPIMKELLFPWNNWHSVRSVADYLLPETSADRRWPVVADPGLSGLSQAQVLEAVIKGSIKAFNNRRFTDLVQLDGQGRLIVADAVRVLRPLFSTVEVNFISNSQPTNLHPLTGTPQTGPAQPIAIPNSFFLSSAVFGGGGDLDGSAGLGIEEATQFRNVAVVQPAEYKKLVEDFGLKISTREPRTLRGDAHFAWFAPENGFVANNWIDKLLQEKVVTPALVAAVLAADLETPILSTARARLLSLVPPNITVTPGEAHPDSLTRAIIAKLEAANPPAGSTEAEFLNTLRSPDPVAAVKARIAAYRDRIVQRLQTDRDAELRRLFGILIARRKAVQDHPAFGNLVESGALLPLP